MSEFEGSEPIMRKPPEQKTRAKSAQAKKPSATSKAKVNPRFAEQTRKILGKHYASKYRVR